MENNLKKEFNKRDVQRMRNIISGNVGEKTQTQVGWDLNKQNHVDGDIWEEGGKRWTIKNGIKQTVTKLDKIKNLVIMPLACPNCGNLIKLHDVEKKMWSIHKMCFDCVLKVEGQIRREGRWSEYESQIINANKNASLDDLERALEEWLVEEDTFVTEQGDIESWDGGNKKDIYKQVKKRITDLKSVDIYNKEKIE